MDEKTYKIQDLIDLVASLRNEGFNEASKHDHPSEETLKKFETLSKEIKEHTDKISAIYHGLFGVEGKDGLFTKVDNVLEQTKKTNGRVTKLEYQRYYITGIVAVIVVVGLPMMWLFINKLEKVDSAVTSHIASGTISTDKKIQ